MLWKTYELDEGVGSALKKAVDDMIRLLKHNYIFHSMVIRKVPAFPPDDSGIRLRLQLNYESH